MKHTSNPLTLVQCVKITCAAPLRRATRLKLLLGASFATAENEMNLGKNYKQISK